MHTSLYFTCLPLSSLVRRRVVAIFICLPVLLTFAVIHQWQATQSISCTVLIVAVVVVVVFVVAVAAFPSTTSYYPLASFSNLKTYNCSMKQEASQRGRELSIHSSDNWRLLRLLHFYFCSFSPCLFVHRQGASTPHSNSTLAAVV